MVGALKFHGMYSIRMKLKTKSEHVVFTKCKPWLGVSEDIVLCTGKNVFMYHTWHMYSSL